jgi:hypothetical protein
LVYITIIVKITFTEQAVGAINSAEVRCEGSQINALHLAVVAPAPGAREQGGSERFPLSNL